MPSSSGISTEAWTMNEPQVKSQVVKGKVSTWQEQHEQRQGAEREHSTFRKRQAVCIGEPQNVCQVQKGAQEEKRM